MTKGAPNTSPRSAKVPEGRQGREEMLVHLPGIMRHMRKIVYEEKTIILM